MTTKRTTTDPPASADDLDVATRAVHEAGVLADISVELLERCDRLLDVIEDQRDAFKDVLLIFAKNGYKPAAQALITMRELERKAKVGAH